MTSDGVSERLALNDVLDAYARGVDMRDWDTVRSLFTPDADLDYTAFGGPKGSPSDVFDWIAANLVVFPMSQHHITNRMMTIDGEAATCRADLLAIMGMGSGDGKLDLMFTGGVYKDTFTKTGEGWRISARECDMGWLASGPKAAGPDGPK